MMLDIILNIQRSFLLLEDSFFLHSLHSRLGLSPNQICSGNKLVTAYVSYVFNI